MIIRLHKWLVLLVIGCLGLCLFALHPTPIVEACLVLAFGILALTGILLGIRINRPSPLITWILIGAGQLLTVIGDTLFSGNNYLGINMGSSDLISVIYLVGLLLFVTGYEIFFWRYRHYISRGSLVNGLIIATGLGVSIALFKIFPASNTFHNLLDWVNYSITPGLVFLLLYQSAIIVMTPIGKHRAYRMLLFSIFFNLIGASFDYAVGLGVNPIGVALKPVVYLNDAAYSSMYLLLGVAILHPSISLSNLGKDEQIETSSRLERLLLGMCVLIIPVCYFILYPAHRNPNALLTIGSMGVIFLLVLWRYNHLALVLKQQNSLLHDQKARLDYQAHTDALTGLPNRSYLEKHLGEVVERSNSQNRPGAVLLMDLDRFKDINDTFGHDRGDLVLRQISHQLIGMKRKDDCTGRWGGDEFLFILEDITEENALAFARRLCQSIEQTVEHDWIKVTVSASMGICSFPNSGSDLKTILKKADIALYRSKKKAGDRIEMFHD